MGEDGSGILEGITKEISNNNHVNINSINIAGDGSLFKGKFTITVNNKLKLKKITEQLLSVKGVRDIKRII